MTTAVFNPRVPRVWSDGAAGPVAVPGLELDALRIGVTTLAVRQHIASVEMQRVFRVAGQDHQVLVVQHQVDAFRKTVQAAYQNSDYAKVWPKGLVDRVNAVK